MTSRRSKTTGKISGKAAGKGTGRKARSQPRPGPNSGSRSQGRGNKTAQGKAAQAKAAVLAAEQAELPREKVHKLLARAGVGSRRAMETAISANRVLVNGEPVTLGDRATAADRITLDGALVRVPESESQVLPRVLVYNKPIGEVCTRKDPEGRRTCFDGLPSRRGGRWVAVGRLDITTSGLLLFTDSGELANKLMHPSSGLDREYAARVTPEPTNDHLKALRQGVQLDDGLAKFTDIQSAGGGGQNHWYHVALMEGRNREVRRLWESQGMAVSRLKRVRFGPVVMPSVLSAGKWLELEEEETRALAELAGLELPSAAAMPARRRGADAKAKRRAPVLLPYPGMTFKPWR